jgi:hypothetical protein
VWPLAFPSREATHIATGLPTHARTSRTPWTRPIPPLRLKHPFQHFVQTLTPLRYTPFPFSILMFEFHFQAYDTHRGLSTSVLFHARIFHSSISRLPTHCTQTSPHAIIIPRCVSTNQCLSPFLLLENKTEVAVVCCRVLYPVAHPARPIYLSCTTTAESVASRVVHVVL